MRTVLTALLVLGFAVPAESFTFTETHTTDDGITVTCDRVLAEPVSVQVTVGAAGTYLIPTASLCARRA